MFVYEVPAGEVWEEASESLENVVIDWSDRAMNLSQLVLCVLLRCLRESEMIREVKDLSRRGDRRQVLGALR